MRRQRVKRKGEGEREERGGEVEGRKYGVFFLFLFTF